MKRYIPFIIGAFLIFINPVYAQTTKAPLNADSLATGNYKDVLSSFFQLAFNKFTGKDKEISFTSNPFAVMAKMDTSLLIDTNYIKYRHLRDLNFSFTAKLDSSYKFNGFSSSIKYALINKRDETVSRAFVLSVADDNKVRELFAINDSLEAYISTLNSQPALRDTMRKQKTDFFRGNINFNQLDISLQEKIKKFATKINALHILSLIKEDPEFNMIKTSKAIYDNLKKTYNNKLLWTISISDTTYKDQFAFSNLVFTSELVKGIGDTSKRNNIEINLKAALQGLDDTTISSRNLKRSVFSFEPGLNFILNAKETKKSIFEFKLSGSYYHTFSTLYKDEKRDILTLNSTLRVRIINDIWIPLEIKYDPKSGNVFGFLNIRTNFTGLGKLLKSK